MIFCPVHLRQGIRVTLAGTRHETPYCPLCLFPEVKR